MGKIVVVTGSGRGLGYCITQRQLQMGNTVYALEHKITDELRKLGNENSNLHISECDVSSDDSTRLAVQQLLKTEKRVDIVFSVAGVFSWDGDVGLAQTSIDMCMLYFNVNALGTLRLCREIWPLIQNGTAIAIVSSEAGSVGGARRKFRYAYCMSKTAVNMLGKLLSNELWDIGGRVILFDPGFMRTVMGGEKAKKSPDSVDPSEPAGHIVDIMEKIETIPRDQMYMTHKGVIIPW